MAGDWIKMRLDLQTHPKIVRILSATKSDKFRVIGGLHAVWSVFDTHSADGRLDGYTADTLDHIIGWPGFSEAMITVGWLAEDGEVALLLPEYDEHNGKSGKRRAEDQKRKKEDRKDPQSVRKVSATKSDESGTREEKRREDKEQKQLLPAAPKFNPAKELEFRGVSAQTAHDWLEVRKSKKAVVTVTALEGIIKEAEKAGLSLDNALALSCKNGWAGFKAEWIKDSIAAPAPKDWI